MGKKFKKREKHNLAKLLQICENMINYKYERPIIINGIMTDYTVTRDGKVISYKYMGTKTPVELKHVYGANGYHMVNLLVNGKSITCKVYRLVANAFIPNPDNKPQVNHKDGNKDNNCDWNLEWVTSKENIDHAIRHNLMTAGVGSGENHPNSTITEKTARYICELLEQNELSYDEISKLTGASCSVIGKIKNGYRWKNVSKDYNVSNYTRKNK